MIYVVLFPQIFVPIHQKVHWCLAVINKKEEKFQYLDSLGGMDTNVLKVLVCFDAPIISGGEIAYLFQNSVLCVFSASP